MDNATVVFVLGGPGTGKGTHCARLANKYGWVHLSTGDLFRAEVQRGTEQGKLLVDIMHEGDMAPPEITLGLLEAAMKESTTKKFLIDGFPRAMDQVHAYQEWFGRQGNAVMFFACTEECMTERIMLRGEGREDDNPETIQKRLAKYREVSVAVIEWYRAHTDILKTIDANRPLEVVAADVDAYISGLEAKLGVASAAPAAAAAARAPIVNDSEGDLIALDGPNPSQAPVFLDLDGEGPASMTTPSGDAFDVQDPLAALAKIEESESAGATMPSSTTPPEATAHAAALEEPTDSSALNLRPVVIIGPSGVGKGTLVGKFMERHGAHFGFTVSHTTRTPRPGEQDGVQYHFVAREEMERAISVGEFLEHAEVHGNLYGTSVAAVTKVKGQGKTAIVEIDVQGAKQVQAGPHGHSALFIFVMPPSMEELEKRLRGRGTEAEEKIQRRLANARMEVEAAKEPDFVSKIIVNNDVDTAVGELEAAIAAHLPELNIVPTATAEKTTAQDVLTVPGVPKGTAGDPGGDECACQGTNEYTKESAAEKQPQLGQDACEAAPSTTVKQYLRNTVVVPVEEAMLALVKARPTDPLQFMIDHLVSAKAKRDL